MNDQTHLAPLEQLLWDLVSEDGAIGNGKLQERFLEAAAATGLAASEQDFMAVKEALIAAGRLLRGKGRGGSVRRAALAGDDFALKAQAPAPQDEIPKRAKSAAKLKTAGAKVVSYRYDDKRKNNPRVGMVDVASDRVEEETRWSYDPHIDPALQFDPARSKVEALIDEALSATQHEAEQAKQELLEWIDHALAARDESAIREVVANLRKRISDQQFLKTQSDNLAALKRMQAPYLNWTGKAERSSFEVDTVSLHVHERIDPATILASVQKRIKGEKGMGGAFQPDLFSAPFENLPLREAIDFYKHDRDWANRLIAGDSLLVMNSLLQKEGMAGQVQMIYIDPPYGIKYGSNFQPFVNKRDVKDRKDEDLTQEPEMIKAFRDTWELGIHSYLTYLRDRLLLARELLSESGSVFVQISDENLHHVREVMDEIYGGDKFCGVIVFRKTTTQSGDVLPATNDFLVWYAKNRKKVKFRTLYQSRAGFDWVNYDYIKLDSGQCRRMAKQERDDPEGFLPKDAKIYRRSPLTSPDRNAQSSGSFIFRSDSYSPGNGHWKTSINGLQRLTKMDRLESYGATLSFRRFADDFPYFSISDTWTDTAQGGYGDQKVYVVQTGQKVVERCLLMTTDPGDVVIDPTCGSGTTAFVAEKWGRRWITCDTSRVSVTLAKQRLMTASYDYYALRYAQEGLKGGFVYKTVPHVTLKSIANNPEIDEIYEAMHPAIEQALSDLNGALKGKALTWKVTEGGRKGGTVDFAASDSKTVTLPSGEMVRVNALLEWEVPFEFPDDWPAAARKPFDAFHAGRQAMQKKMDDSIAADADQETLYDQPQVDKSKLRITGPFTVEAVPFPTVLGLDEAEQPKEADVAVARSGETSRQAQWRDELLKAGIRGKGGQKLKLADLEPVPGLRYIHLVGTLAENGERVAVSFGPEHAALEQRQVEIAMREAGELFPLPKMLVFCAFTFDPEAAKDIDNIKGITALKVQMNTDLLTEDLKKARASNESFWLMGQPDVEVRPLKDGRYQVEVHGFDYFDTKTGELRAGGKKNIAVWELDTDYDDRSLYPSQVFFPMAGAKDGWHKLKKDIRAELNEELLEKFHGTTSLPFEAGENRRIAVKITDDRGIESLRVMDLD